MLQFIKKLFSKKERWVTVENVFIPKVIQAIATMYPILYNIPGNTASGEIKKFYFSTSLKRMFPIGDRIILVDNTESSFRKWDCTWVHLGQDFFKLICKTHENISTL